MKYTLILLFLCACVTTPPPLPKGSGFVPATPDTTRKVMALRRSSVEPPIPSLGEPQRPLPHPNVPERAGFDVEKERARIAAMLSEKAKAVQSGILYPYEVKELNNFFDTPDDWTGWLIQRRGPQDNHWSECGKSAGEPTKGCTVAGSEGFQYRLLRTAP